MKDSIYLHALSRSYQRFLDQLIEELSAYTDEDLIWQTSAAVSNSAGNLALHVLGNLNHFIGATLGNSGYLRDRPLEFSIKNKPKAEIIADIKETKEMLNSILPNLSREILNGEYPHKFGDETWTTHEWLIQCNTHLAYHLGQINYHRRLLDVS